MFEKQTNPFGYPHYANAGCVEAEALVIIEAVPLCCVDSFDMSAPEVMQAACPASSSESKSFGGGLPARCATIMPCAQALSLVEGVGHVFF